MKRLIFIFLLFSSLCLAEPTGPIKYLMNEPLTLFDSGMIQLDSTLHKYCDNIKSGTRPDMAKYWEILESSYIFPGIDYNWDTNRLLISVPFITGAKKFPEEKLKDFMTFFVNDIKSFLGVSKATGKQYKEFYATYFYHAGFQSKNQPKNIADELYNITEIEVYTFVDDDKKFSAFSKLSSKDIMFSKDK